MADPPSAFLSMKSNTIHAHNISIEQNIHPNQAFLPRRDPIEILHEHVAFGALWNSDERYDPPKCHPQTRTAILDRIDRWSGDISVASQPILWLSGPAGAGKSAIAQTLVERWKKRDVMVVAFFFWRTNAKRNQKTYLVPTIAFQLLELFPSIRPEFEAAINAGGLFKRNLAFQLDKLVIEPLRGIAASQGQQSIVIVIDGLDECCIDLPKEDDFPGQTYESQQEEILEIFGSACRALPYLRLLIVSRPERQMRRSFATESLAKLTLPLSLKDVQDASAEILLFLNCKFQEIRNEHGIESSWPTEAQLSELVRKSSGQFIYPSIAIKHIRQARANPMQRLKAVLELQTGSVNHPLTELDMLYTLILKSVSSESLPLVTDILGYISLYPETLTPLVLSGYDFIDAIFIQRSPHSSLLMFEKLLFLSEGEASSHMTDMHSILNIGQTRSPINFIHATFSEYLGDKSRSGDFFIDPEVTRIRYAHILCRHLQEWNPSAEGQVYDIYQLFTRAPRWITQCKPSKSLRDHVWNLVRVEFGHNWFDSNSSLARNQISIHFIPYLKEQNDANLIMQMLLGYLKNCNRSEIEPSWWRRFLFGRYLDSAMSRYPLRRSKTPVR